MIVKKLLFLPTFLATLNKYHTGNRNISKMSPIIVKEDSNTVQITEKKFCANGKNRFQRGKKSSKSSAKGRANGAKKKVRMERMVLVAVRKHFMAFWK